MILSNETYFLSSYSKCFLDYEFHKDIFLLLLSNSVLMCWSSIIYLENSDSLCVKSCLPFLRISTELSINLNAGHWHISEYPSYFAYAALLPFTPTSGNWIFYCLIIHMTTVLVNRWQNIFRVIILMAICIWISRWLLVVRCHISYYTEITFYCIDYTSFYPIKVNIGC